MLVCVATATADDRLLAQYPRDVVSRDIEQTTDCVIAERQVVIDFDKMLAGIVTTRVVLRTAIAWLDEAGSKNRAPEEPLFP